MHSSQEMDKTSSSTAFSQIRQRSNAFFLRPELIRGPPCPPPRPPLPPLLPLPLLPLRPPLPLRAPRTLTSPTGDQTRRGVFLRGVLQKLKENEGIKAREGRERERARQRERKRGSKRGRDRKNERKREREREKERGKAR